MNIWGRVEVNHHNLLGTIYFLLFIMYYITLVFTSYVLIRVVGCWWIMRWKGFEREPSWSE
jgi:hypothetical protein